MIFHNSHPNIQIPLNTGALLASQIEPEALDEGLRTELVGEGAEGLAVRCVSSMHIIAQILPEKLLIEKFHEKDHFRGRNVELLSVVVSRSQEELAEGGLVAAAVVRDIEKVFLPFVY